MFRIHCNRCYCQRTLEPTVVFHLTRCQHVLCDTCISDSSLEKKCPICKEVLNGIPINRDMPRGMAEYFADPFRFQQLYRKISEFQSNQRASDNMGFYRQMQQHESNKLRLEGFSKLKDQLDKQIQKEKKRIAELRAYIAYHEETTEIKRRHSADERPQSSDSINCSQKRRRRPRTPSITTSDNTQSDEAIESYWLDSDTDFSIRNKQRRSAKQSFSGDDQDFRI
ncbi:RING finger protein nenya [Drosophila ficusphila]|uniref:RING finger protein nenya n=1 Tax=Drosophila ficusphila TaxID=30025 RepID=UPI0007E67219|nr:RING finger protein nenya [Drosophila ficusphila]